MKLLDVAVVVMGAGIGGGLRFVLGGWMAERWGSAFPWHTFAINVGGAFLFGVLTAVALGRTSMPPSMVLFLGVGVLGGFTTFSTLSVESVALIQLGMSWQGVAYMFGSAVAGLAAAVLGLFAGKAL